MKSEKDVKLLEPIWPKIVENCQKVTKKAKNDRFWPKIIMANNIPAMDF